jgi:hypothetical protein
VVTMLREVLATGRTAAYLVGDNAYTVGAPARPSGGGVDLGGHAGAPAPR